MTIKDDGKPCFDCNQIGRVSKAHRIMPSGAAVCEEHYRQRMGLPQRTSEAADLVKRWQSLGAKEEAASEPESKGETQMAKSPDQSTIDAMRKDATAGIGTNAIAEKHGVTWATAKKYTGGDGTKVAKKNASKIGRAQSDGAITIQATPAMLDAIWNSLPLEKKAELLKGL
jgi:hypothetical protein